MTRTLFTIALVAATAAAAQDIPSHPDELTFEPMSKEQIRKLLQQHGKAVLLKKAAKIPKGSGEPNKNKIGKVTKKQLREIAEVDQGRA